MEHEEVTVGMEVELIYAIDGPDWVAGTQAIVTRVGDPNDYEYPIRLRHADNECVMDVAASEIKASRVLQTRLFYCAKKDTCSSSVIASGSSAKKRA